MFSLSRFKVKDSSFGGSRSTSGGVTGSAEEALISWTGTPKASVIAEEPMLTKVEVSVVPRPATAVMPFKSSLLSIIDTTEAKLVPAVLELSV